MCRGCAGKTGCVLPDGTVARRILRSGYEMNEALLVIDVQNEYFSGKLPVTYPPGSFENILKAMDGAQDAHMPVIVIQHANPADAPAFARGTHGWELHDAIKARPHALLLEKTLPGSFTGTSLGLWLEEQGI